MDNNNKLFLTLALAIIIFAAQGSAIFSYPAPSVSSDKGCYDNAGVDDASDDYNNGGITFDQALVVQDMYNAGEATSDSDTSYSSSDRESLGKSCSSNTVEETYDQNAAAYFPSFGTDGQCYIFENGDGDTSSQYTSVTESCSTGDTCSWSDSGGQYCSGGDVVQDETYSGTNYQGCSGGSCSQSSCSGSNTYEVEDCGNSYCDTGGDVNKYCNNNDVWGSYDYRQRGCSSGSCTSDWNYNSCGNEKLQDCATGTGNYGTWTDTGSKRCSNGGTEKQQSRSYTDYNGCGSGSCQSSSETEYRWVDVVNDCRNDDTCSWSDSGGQYCSDEDSDGASEVVQDETYSGTNYEGCSGGNCQQSQCSGSDTYIVNDCRSDESGTSWSGDYYCSGGDVKEDGTYTDYTGCGGSSCGQTQRTDTRTIEECTAAESCDASSGSCVCPDNDGDGYSDAACGGQDCDDSDSSQNPDTTWYYDGDGDGYYSQTTTQCGDPGPDWSMDPGNGGGDCDDSDSAKYPGNTETCSNKDNNCDGIVDNNRAGTKNTACMQINTVSTGASQGSGWVEDNRLHWSDGSTEYQAYNEGNVVQSGVSGEEGHSWVEGKYIHWIDQNGNERRFLGQDTGTDISGSEGQGWIESGNLHYIDQNSNERTLN